MRRPIDPLKKLVAMYALMFLLIVGGVGLARTALAYLRIESDGVGCTTCVVVCELGRCWRVCVNIGCEVTPCPSGNPDC